MSFITSNVNPQSDNNDLTELESLGSDDVHAHAHLQQTTLSTIPRKPPVSHSSRFPSIKNTSQSQSPSSSPSASSSSASSTPIRVQLHFRLLAPRQHELSRREQFRDRPASPSLARQDAVDETILRIKYGGNIKGQGQRVLGFPNSIIKSDQVTFPQIGRSRQ